MVSLITNTITKESYMMLLQFSHPVALVEKIIKSDFNTETELENKIVEKLFCRGSKGKYHYPKLYT